MTSMGQAPSDLQTPFLLLAMPQVVDPFFHRSVVLLLHHDEEGSFGFIVNRPTQIQLSEILLGMEVRWEGAKDTLAYFGGPVQSQLGSVVFETGGGAFEADDEHSTVVSPGLRMTQHLGELSRLAADPPERFRLFLGYAGWGAGQLVDEILRNDWLTAPMQPNLVFAAHPSEAWQSALQSVGVDPATLPSWTTPQRDDEQAN